LQNNYSLGTKLNCWNSYCTTPFWNRGSITKVSCISWKLKWN